MSGARATAPLPTKGAWYWSAEASCVLLGLALAASTTRLFSTTDAVTTLAAVAVASGLSAIALRRSPLPPLLGDVLQLAIGALVLLWVIAPRARIGPLPGPGSITTLAQVIRDDFSLFDEDIAPMVARPGHLAVLAALVWGLGLFCSTTAMRLRAPAQAALPHVVAIVGLGFVSRDQGRAATAAILLVAVAAYALAQAAWRNSAYHWQPPWSSGVKRPLGVGAIVVAVAIASAAVFTPLSPVRADPVLDLRRGGLGDDGGPRTVVSPFVEVGSNLGPRSDELLFTAATETPGYWRLTSLEDYDPDTGAWALANSYERVEDGLLAAGGSEVSTLPVSEVVIEALGGIWVPTPSDPVLVESTAELNWDPDSGSLVNRSGELAGGESFVFASDPLEPLPELLGGAPAATSDADLLDDEGIPPVLRDLADDLTRDLDPYEAALAIQNWFRDNFTYDESVDFSASADPLQSFLDTRAGFCQQFSTGFALAARSIGLPTRVVVGFTTGESDPAAAGTYEVYGRNAHAWPEVLLSGVGWVPFEPTPGRGNPATTAITGVPPAQAPAPPGGSDEAAPGTSAETPQTTTPPPAGEDQSGGSDDTEVATSTAGDEDTAGSGRWGPLAVGLVVLAAVAVMMWLRRRHSVPAGGVDAVSGAWQEACRMVVNAGVVGMQLRPEPHETPLEFAERVDRVAGLAPMRALAELETVRRWSRSGSDAEDEHEAAVLLDQLRGELEARSAHTEDQSPQPV